MTRGTSALFSVSIARISPLPCAAWTAAMGSSGTTASSIYVGPNASPPRKAIPAVNCHADHVGRDAVTQGAKRYERVLSVIVRGEAHNQVVSKVQGPALPGHVPVVHVSGQLSLWVKTSLEVVVGQALCSVLGSERVQVQDPGVPEARGPVRVSVRVTGRVHPRLHRSIARAREAGLRAAAPMGAPGELHVRHPPGGDPPAARSAVRRVGQIDDQFPDKAAAALVTSALTAVGRSRRGARVLARHEQRSQPFPQLREV